MVSYGSLGFLADPFFLARSLLLLLLIFGAFARPGTGRPAGRGGSAAGGIRGATARFGGFNFKLCQRTATDLAGAPRGLQEVAKALSATLYLDETLHTIADPESRVVETPYCAVALLDGERQAVNSVY